jgi:iron transport multicopper oxidase
VYSVALQLRYRLRVIHAGSEISISFQIDGHRLLVIAADGVDVEPYHTGVLQLQPGQRYDVILDADQAISNYWIRAGNTRAILRYLSAPASSPTTSAESKPEMSLTPPLKPYYPAEVVPAFVRHTIDITSDAGASIGTKKWFLNDQS